MSALLEARDLCVDYGGVRAVDGVFLTVDPGEVVALVGPNGSGKSSVLKAIAQVTAHTGQVCVAGADLARLPRRQRVSRVAYVPQLSETELDLTVGEIVQLGAGAGRGLFARARRSDAERVRHSLAHVGMAGLADRRWSELSGGQRQRVSIARGLVQEARLLLLDEPTNHLDIRHQLRLVPMVRHLVERHGTAVLIVLHDLGLAARLADRVVVLDAGRTVASGPPAAALSPGQLAKTFGVHGRIHRPAGSQAAALLVEDTVEAFDG